MVCLLLTKLHLVYAHALVLGKFVSESKFTAHPADFIPHIINKDRQALADLITKPAVERALLHRLSKKAGHYGADIGLDGERVRKSPSSLYQTRGILPAIGEGMSPKVDREARGLHFVPASPAPSVSVVNTPAGASFLLSDNASSIGGYEELEEYEWKIDVEEVRHLYESWIIPLTKEVEVSYYHSVRDWN